MITNLTSIWTKALEEVRTFVPTPAYKSLIATLTPIALEDNQLILAVPTKFNKDMVESRYIEVLSQSLSSSYGSDLLISLEVREAARPEKQVNHSHSSSIASDESLNGILRSPTTGPRQGPAKKNYNFDHFVEGPSNRFAYAAAQTVAEYPGTSYNPLFIYGGTGLGKTHLLLAIDEYSRRLNPKLRVRYVEASTFIDDFVNTLRDKKNMRSFDTLYINYDILLVDDIHILGRTEFSQDKFFDIFNRLHGAGAQIVLSSDRPPREISTLEERLQSRFSWGLTIDIKPPDLETRIAILRMKAQVEGAEVPDDVHLFIASKVQSNIRELEGCLNRVLAHSRLDDYPINLIMAQQILSGLLPETTDNQFITIDSIQRVACDYYGVNRSELIGSSRSRSLVHARQIAMYLCRELTDESLIRVGGEFGGRDHSTVIHSCKKVDLTMKQNKQIFNEIQDLTNHIKKTA